MTKIQITVDDSDIAELNRLRGYRSDSAGRALLRVIEAGERPAAVPTGGRFYARSIAEALTSGPDVAAIVDELRVAYGMRVGTFEEAIELASLRRMREALVNLRDRLGAERSFLTYAAEQIDEVIAMSAAPAAERARVDAMRDVAGRERAVAPQQGESMSNFKINEIETRVDSKGATTSVECMRFAEEAIRVHASAIKGCRDLTYSVCTARFDDIWRRTKARVDRSFPEPRLEIFFGRHYVLVIVDDDVPMDEVKFVEDSAPCPARHRQGQGASP